MPCPARHRAPLVLRPGPARRTLVSSVGVAARAGIIRIIYILGLSLSAGHFKVRLSVPRGGYPIRALSRSGVQWTRVCAGAWIRGARTDVRSGRRDLIPPYRIIL